MWFVTTGFVIMDLKFQNYVCNGWDNLSIQCVNISNFAIITVKCADLFVTLANPMQLIY